MSLRTSARVVALLAACLVTIPACSPRTQVVQVGRTSLKLVPLPGWEHLDHGRQHLFRNGETELALTDLGPATPEGLADELRDAEALWLAGRRLDAIAQVRQVQGVPLWCLSREARHDYMRPWLDVIYERDIANRPEVGTAIQALIRKADSLPPPTPSQLMAYALADYSDTDRREIGQRQVRWVNGSEWIAFRTWDRVSHSYRRSYACLEAGGRLLRLSTERGHESQTESAFDSLFTSIQLSDEE